MTQKEPSADRGRAVLLERVTKRFASNSSDEYTARAGRVAQRGRRPVPGHRGPYRMRQVHAVLHMVAGLLHPSERRICVHGEPVTGLNRRVGYMFQQDALLPWKSVLDNVTLDSGEEIAASMPDEYAGDDPSLYEAAIENSKPMFSPDGRMDPEGAEAVLSVLRQSDEEVARADIDLARTCTNDLVDGG